MASFEYTARTLNGQEVRGVMQADSQAAVARALDERELFLVQAREKAMAAALPFVGGRIRASELAVMYGQMADLLRAGVPLLRALGTLRRATKNRKLLEKLVALQEDVEAGESLADALAKHPKAFPVLHSAMVRAGERAGFLEDVLTNISQFLERQDELRSKIKGAMVYPLVLVTLGTVIVTGILIFLVPLFREPFEGIPSLPVPTVVLFAVSDSLRNHWVLSLGGIAAAAAGSIYAVHSEAGRRFWDRWKLKIPIYGRVAKTITITRFCRILGTMLANGVPILQALGISRGAAGNKLLEDSLEQASENVRAGEPLAGALRGCGMFPEEILEMISVAEESNQMEKVLVNIADTVERRMNRQVDAAVRLIEPLILVVIAAAIGFVAVGLMFPIFTMVRMVGR